MKVTYRLRDLCIYEEIDMQYKTQKLEKLMQKYIVEKNPEVCAEIHQWFISVLDKPPTLDIVSEKDFLNDRIKCALSFELEDGDALLFKLKFGNGV
jgi:hypothetical protein